MDFKVSLKGFKGQENIELFKALNALPFREELEEALADTFNEVLRVLTRFNQERSDTIDAEQAALQEHKETLRKLERNITEMGLFDANQLPLPFSNNKVS